MPRRRRRGRRGRDRQRRGERHRNRAAAWRPRARERNLARDGSARRAVRRDLPELEAGGAQLRDRAIDREPDDRGNESPGAPDRERQRDRRARGHHRSRLRRLRDHAARTRAAAAQPVYLSHRQADLVQAGGGDREGPAALHVRHGDSRKRRRGGRAAALREQEDDRDHGQDRQRRGPQRYARGLTEHRLEPLRPCAGETWRGDDRHGVVHGAAEQAGAQRVHGQRGARAPSGRGREARGLDVDPARAARIGAVHVDHDRVVRRAAHHQRELGAPLTGRQRRAELAREHRDAGRRLGRGDRYGFRFRFGLRFGYRLGARPREPARAARRRPVRAPVPVRGSAPASGLARRPEGNGSDRCRRLRRNADRAGWSRRTTGTASRRARLEPPPASAPVRRPPRAPEPARVPVPARGSAPV